MRKLKQETIYAVTSCEIIDDAISMHVVFATTSKEDATNFLRDLLEHFRECAYDTKTTTIFGFELITKHSRVAYDLCELPPIMFDPKLIY